MPTWPWRRFTMLVILSLVSTSLLELTTCIYKDGTTTSRTFTHIHSEIQAEEAEEIGVEHLLRDVKDNAVGSLTTRVSTTFDGLRSLHRRLADIHSYLEKVAQGSLPINHDIIYNLQSILNLLPNLSASSVAGSFVSTGNDRLLVVYLASLIRATVALHQLIDNKIENRDSSLVKQNITTSSKALAEEVVGK
eukprot:Partr_v1_DN27408_c2_g1_i1_m72354 putative Proteasome (Prosome, macropain) 26S subunit, non-ATPase, 7